MTFWLTATEIYREETHAAISWATHSDISARDPLFREEPEMSKNFSSGVNRMWRFLTSHSFHP